MWDWIRDVFDLDNRADASRARENDLRYGSEHAAADREAADRRDAERRFALEDIVKKSNVAMMSNGAATTRPGSGTTRAAVGEAAAGSLSHNSSPRQQLMTYLEAQHMRVTTSARRPLCRRRWW